MMFGGVTLIDCLIDCLGEFSRAHCLGICAFLVPANLVITVQTLLFVGLGWRRRWVLGIAVPAIAYASAMLLHVLSWYVVGVVMAPTFVLALLGMACLGINGFAIARSHRLQHLLDWGWQRAATAIGKFVLHQA